MVSKVIRSQTSGGSLECFGTVYECIADQSVAMWFKISEEHFRHLVESLLQRLVAFLGRNGGATQALARCIK